MKVLVYTDAGSRGNPGPSAYAVVVCSEDGKRLMETARYIGEGTNNEAEYRGVLAGLEEAKAMGADEIVLTSDSELLVRQVNRQYRIKAANLRPLAEEVWRRMSEFARAELRHVHREHPMISRADLLVNQELDAMAFARKLRR
jgi:ribonuclease HI